MPIPPVEQLVKPESVCAVVPTYNCKQPLANCLEVLRRQTRPVDEIIVVDNASTDGTGEMIRERFAGSVTYVRLPENRGGAGGFDHGMRLACERGHDWIWCMDSDALPSERTLADLLSAACPSRRPIVAKTSIFRDPPTGVIFCGGGSPLSPDGDRPANFTRASWEGKVVPVDLAPFICLLVKADAAKQAGFIPADLFIDCDDYFFSRELRTQGEIIQVGTTVVDHCKSAEQYCTRRGHRRTAIEYYWRTYYATRNRLLYQKRYIGFRKVVLRSMYDYLRSLATILVLDDHKLYRIRILTKGYWDGFLGRAGKRVDPRDFQLRYGPHPVAR